MNSYINRMIRAAKLDVNLYEEVEADKGAMGQAMGVVALSSVAAGIGSSAAGGVTGIIVGLIGALAAWFIWAFITYFIGTKLLPEPQTHADHGELLRLIEKHMLPESAQPATSKPIEYPMVGSCNRMKDIQQQVVKIAPTDATVLILGESGTGKELLARNIHLKSKRKDQPFIIFNCAAVPQNAIETELFGTTNNNDGLIAQANHGSLFLDEVGELPLDAQARLLRVLQGDSLKNNHDVRILAATHRNIRQLVDDGTFRNDLYFRIRVIEIALPPLRERDDDIIELSLFWLNRFKQQIDKPDLQLTRSALEAIRRYNWPGNIRELGNAIERAAILAETNDITPELLAIDRPVQNALSKEAMNDNLSLEEYFRCFVLEHQNNMTETELAKNLGISRKALWERRQRFGLPRPKKS